ncbi:MAG TPA: VWA domain-containing protein, partial [Magnetococcales bacterium]|nr:VWA domain-containing protein [Magnetococcales bacterium]
MNDLHFAQPGWVHGLWGVLVLMVVLWVLERRSGHVLLRFIAAGLQGSLVRGIHPLRRWLRLVFLLASLVCLTIALMRPQWGVHWVTAPRSGAEIMVCLDVSKSMLAEDVAPNRLERAKAELRDLLPYLRGSQLGLIVFSGRATVLSPLTPDFGFFRLALDQAGVHSVSRGGTRLEEPIRKAIAGFGSGGELSRSILLITDGEDQDSFPLEAAKEAAKRGIRILAIGFGAEAGSEIVMTDHKTGVRSVLKDQADNVVKSRLDGHLLREIALITEGAYIPAGVGVLDLKAIYDRHIAALTRGMADGTRQTIQNDAFQWAVLLGLFFLLAAVLTNFQVRQQGVWLLVLGMLIVPGVTRAGEGPGTDATAKEATRKPREDFNLGLENVGEKKFDAAQSLLVSARDRAGTDAELRFRATYDLGWVEAGRAGAKLEADPKEALACLNRAAAWFREAVSLRPDHEESRYNLEVVLGKAMALADRLAASSKGDIAVRLEGLVQAQRGFLEEVGRVVEGLDKKAGESGEMDPGVRQAFRDLSARQLEIVSQGEELGGMA